MSDFLLNDLVAQSALLRKRQKASLILLPGTAEHETLLRLLDQNERDFDNYINFLQVSKLKAIENTLPVHSGLYIVLKTPVDRIAAYCILKNFGERIVQEDSVINNFNEVPSFLCFDEVEGIWDLCITPMGREITIAELYNDLKAKQA